MSVESGANSGSPVALALLWVSKAAVLWLVLLLAAVVAGKLVPVSIPMPLQDGPLTTTQAFLVVNGLAALALALVAAISRVRGLGLGAVLFVAYFMIGSAMMQIETLYFNESVKMPLTIVGHLVSQAAIIGAIAALVGTLLFRPVVEGPGPVPAHLGRRIALMAVIYVVLYYAAGLFFVWQNAAARAYYGNGIHISFPLTVAFQVFRGALWALISLYILSHMKGPLAARALVIAVLFAVMTAPQLLYPNPLMPWEVRQAHLVEMGTSEFAYGIIVTLILLSGAARRPLADASPWRLITGKSLNPILQGAPDMSEQSTIHEDISYLRKLAESGRKGPILGGVFLVAAGVVFGLASILSWAVREGLLPIKGWVELYLWLGASAVFALFWVVAFLRLMRHKHTVATTSNSVFGTIWSASGIGVMVVFAATLIIANKLHAPIILNGYLPVIFAFYGTAWFASAALAKRRWMFIAALGSFTFAFLVALLTETQLQGLAIGAGLILLLSLPGLKLMSDARS